MMLPEGWRRGRELPSYGTAWPDLHMLLEPVCASENTVTVRWTAHRTHRGDSAMVWHRLGESGNHLILREH
jgi:hypothetical protein